MSSQKTFRLYVAVPIAIGVLIAIIFYWSNGPILSNLLLFAVFSAISVLLYLFIASLVGANNNKRLNAFRVVVFVNVVLLSINHWVPAEKNAEANLHVHGALLDHIYYSDQLKALSESYELLQADYIYSSLQEKTHGIYSGYKGESPVVDTISYASRIAKLKAKTFDLHSQLNRESEAGLRSSIDSIRFYRKMDSGFMVYYASVGFLQQYNKARLKDPDAVNDIAPYELESKHSLGWGSTLSIRATRQAAAEKFLKEFTTKQKSLLAEIKKPAMQPDISPIIDFRMLAMILLIASFLVWLLRPTR